jgi:hypothetical protein
MKCRGKSNSKIVMQHSNILPKYKGMFTLSCSRVEAVVHVLIDRGARLSSLTRIDVCACTGFRTIQVCLTEHHCSMITTRPNVATTLTFCLLAWSQPIASLHGNVRMSGTDARIIDSMTHDDSNFASNKASIVRSLATDQKKLQQCSKEDDCTFLFCKGTKMHRNRANGRVCVQGCMIASSRFYLQRGWQCGGCRKQKGLPMPPPARAPVQAPTVAPKKVPTVAPMVSKDPPKPPTVAPISTPTKVPSKPPTKTPTKC